MTQRYDHLSDRSAALLATLAAVALVLLAVPGFVPAQEPAANYGPITSRDDGVRRPGTVVWMDLLTGDVERAVAFYEAVFGWRFERSPDGTYAHGRVNGEPVAGISAYHESLAGKDGLWLPSFAVVNVDASVSRVTELGGAIVEAPEALPGRGRYLLAEDASGAPFMLLRAATGDPKRREAIGDWLWNELWTDDLARARTFYQELLGFRSVTVRDGAGNTHEVLGRDRVPHASVLISPIEEVEPSWLGYILVDDIGEAVDAVRKAGGEVIVPPRAGTGTEDMAIVADPTGGVFAMQQREGEG